ncbi:MAG TPA: MFS transporter, partial [Oscillospiraceae bacterium]|nr:MFS transporter [Oscillospiraceae bacterium]
LYIIDTGGSAATVGLFSFLSLIPILLIYPFAGIAGDRLNRKIIMVATDLANGLIILGLAFVAYSGRMSLVLLFTVQVLTSILYGFFDPATKGMLPQVVPKEELTKANSIVASLRIFSGLLSPVIGAAVYASQGIEVLFLINGISFLLSAGSEMLIRYKHIKRDAVVGVSGLVRDLSEGVRFVLGNKIIGKLCVLSLIILALIQPIFSVVLPLFFRTRLEYTDSQYGYLQVVIVFGTLLGSILVGTLFNKGKEVTKALLTGCSLIMGTMLVFTVLLFPQAVLALGNGTMIYFVLFAGILSLLSVAIIFINVPTQTIIQTDTPDEYLSRVFSIVGMISKGGMPFGALIYGIILNRVEVHWTILFAALLIILISVRFIVSFVRVYSQE